jgi:conjugal transfer pilus assembly protein TraW
MSFLVLMTLLSTTHGSAKNLGTYGSVFKVAEISIIEVIQGRLQAMEKAGKMEAVQRELQEKVKDKVNRPTSVEGMTKAKSRKKTKFDPTFVVSQNIKDNKGNLIASEGASYNPLDHKSFGEPLIFIDGDDLPQVQWAISKGGKIILVNGTPLELSRVHKKAFYFDQGGALTEKLGITEVPSLVRQEEKHLVIETIPLTSASLKGEGQ